MKFRLGLLAGLAIILSVGFTSCTRDFICQCEITYTGRPGLPEPVIKEYELTNTKKKAKQECEERSNESEQDGVKTTETCALY